MTAPGVEAPRAPQRLRRSRAAGWSMPDNARYVGRGTRWGNPFRVVGGLVVSEPWWVVEAAPLTRAVRAPAASAQVVYSTHAPDAQDAAVLAVDLFRRLVAVRVRDLPGSAVDRWLAPLRGVDLVCWCPPSAPCHADVLLELVAGGAS